MDSSIHEAIYYGFERELANSMNYIFVDDDQQNTYSIENAALVLKIGAEIESVAKAICKKNKKHKDNHHFDTNCIENNKHKIDAVAIVEGDFHFNNAENTIFWPFTKDEKKYNSNKMTYGWNNAYQAIKHGGLENIKTFGTIKYIIRALGALYALNFELSNKIVHSSFFAYVSGDKLIGQAGGLVWDRLIDLTPEQKKIIQEHNS